MKTSSLYPALPCAICQILSIVQLITCLEVEPKESSFLVQKNDIKEFKRLRDLLGKPIGDATTASATKGLRKTTRFMPKCPEKLADVPAKSQDIILQRCPRLRNKEYNIQEKKVAEIIVKSGKRSKGKYEDQKRAFIEAVNHLAKLAGPLPSL